MDTTASSRPDFRDQNNQDNSIPFHHQQQQQQQQQHYSHPSSSTLQPYLPSTRQQPLPHPFSHQPQSILSSTSLPRHSHDQSRTVPPPLPTPSSSLTNSMLRQHSLPQPPTQSHPQSTLYQPQFKSLPSQPDPSFHDSQTKSPHQHDNLNRAHHLSSSPSQPLHTPPPPLNRHQSTHHDDRPFSNHPTAPTFPPPSAPLTSLDKKPEPFPYSKSLPYPLAHQSQASTKPTSTPQTTPTPSATQPTTQPSSTHQPSAATASPSRPNNTSSNHDNGPLYDIAKLLAAHCTILSGKVYNDKGHNICGVLNQHDKPCKRIGKCPFHGAHKPVTADNSVNGTIDASGTVTTPSTSPDGTHSPPGQSGPAYDTRSPAGSDSTAVTGSRPRIPPKQQYKHGWSKEEHFLFLGGLSQHGKGSWKQIASVVKTRTPTQVQSHAQKYFQRQKQADKNKRSIHDLSLDSPEMIEVAKKFKATGQRIGPSGPIMAEPVAIPGISDSGALRDQGVTMAPSALSLSHNPLHADTVGRGVLNDAGLSRFGTNVQSSLVSKFGPAQATSATTLGSSLSSGVQIPHIPGAATSRSLSVQHTNATQPELFGHLHQGTITSGQHRRPGDNRLPMKMDGTPGRDVILNSVRPAFIPDPYQGNTSGQLIPGQHLLGTKQSLYASHQRATTGLHGNDSGAAPDHGNTQAAYQANALHGLYPQMGGNSTVFPQPRGATETQFQWTYDSDGKPKRPREVHATNRDAFPLQNSQLSTTLQGMGAIPISEHLSGATGIGNDHQVDQPFDGTHQSQGNAFANGIFGGNENVDVDTNVYGVGTSQPGPVGVPGRLGTGVSAYPQSAGVPMGQMHLQTHFGGGAGSYHRND